MSLEIRRENAGAFCASQLGRYVCLSMDINEIHWHDSVLNRVIENPANDTLLFEVDYAVDWENQKWEKRTIIFLDMLNYRVHEGPFQDRPTILDASIVGEENDRKIIRIETNAGFRQLAFKAIEIKPNT